MSSVVSVVVHDGGRTTSGGAGRRGGTNMDNRIEVVILPVANVSRSKAFYEQAGFVCDVDHEPNEHFRIVQLTPPGSPCSIIVGKGIRRRSRGGARAPTRGRGSAGRVRGPAGARHRDQRPLPLRARGSDPWTRPGACAVRVVRDLLGPRRQRLAGPGDPRRDPRVIAAVGLGHVAVTRTLRKSALREGSRVPSVRHPCGRGDNSPTVRRPVRSRELAPVRRPPAPPRVR